MPDVIEALPAIWTWTWHTSLHLCVLICLIRIVQLLFQKFLTPRWHYALWMLVLVRMVMPIGVETPWSVFNLFKTETVVEGEAVAALPAYDFLFESMTQPILINTIERTEFALVHGLAMAWLMGIALLSIHLFRQWTRLREVVAAGTEIKTQEILGTLHTCAKSLRIRHSVTVVECAIPVPGLYGFLRPKILMPQGLCDSLTADELRFILLHELAHYKRLDLPVNWLMTLMQVMHWFNPLVWYGFFRMRTDRELACDALALSHANDDDPEAYGKTLLKLMDENHGIRPVPGMIGILENHAHLKRRIVAIARFTTNSYRWSIPALLILALVGGVTLTQAVQDKERMVSTESTPIEDSITDESDFADEIDYELVWVQSEDGSTFGIFRGVSSMENDDPDAQPLRLKGFDGLTKDPNVSTHTEQRTHVALNDTESGDEDQREYTLLKRKVMELSEAGRALEAIAELDLFRWKYQSHFEDATRLLIELKLKHDMPLTVSEQLQQMRSVELSLESDETIFEPRPINVRSSRGPGTISISANSFEGDIDGGISKLDYTRLAATDTHISRIMVLLDKHFGVVTQIDYEVVAKENSESPEDFLTDGIVDSVELTDQTLEEALDKLLEGLPLDWMYRGKIVFISSPETIWVSRENIALMRERIISDLSGRVIDISQSGVKRNGIRNWPYLRNWDLPTAEDPLRRKISLDYDDMDLASVVSRLAQEGKIDVLASVDLEGKVTIHEKEISVGRAIDKVLAMKRLGIVEESGVYRITSLQESNATRYKQGKGELSRGSRLIHADLPADEDPLRKKVDVDFKDHELQDAIKVLAKKGMIEIVNPEVIEGNVTAKLDDVPLGHAITVLLSMSDLLIVPVGEKYRIVPRDEDPMQQRVNIDFKDIELRNAINLLAQKGEIEFINSDEAEGTVTANLTNIPLRRGLEVLLRMNDLAMVAEGEKYRIVPLDRTASSQIKAQALTIQKYLLSNKTRNLRWIPLDKNGEEIAEPDDLLVLEAYDAKEPPIYDLYNKKVPAWQDPLRKRIDVDVKDVELSKVIALLKEKGKLETIVSAPMKGKVTAHLTDIPVGAAIEVILRMHGLGIMEDFGAFRIDDFGTSTLQNIRAGHLIHSRPSEFLEMRSRMGYGNRMYLSMRDHPLSDEEATSALQRAQEYLEDKQRQFDKELINEKELDESKKVVRELRLYVEQAQKLIENDETAKIQSQDTPPNFTLYNNDLPEDQDPLRKKVNIDFKEMDLKNVSELLSQKGNITIINPEILEGTVTASLNNIPLGRAIEVVLRMNDFRIVKDDEDYKIISYKTKELTESDPKALNRSDPTAPPATLSIAQAEPSSSEIQQKYPYTIPIEMYHQSWSAFQGADAIIVTELRGTSPGIEEGESYWVQGTYSLSSQANAKLHIYATNGEVTSNQGLVVEKGAGAFVREFVLTKAGMLHMSYYPVGGGDGFGGIYFRAPSTQLQNIEVKGALLPKPSAKLERILDEKVGLVFEQIHLSEIAEVINKNYDVAIVIDPKVVLPKGTVASTPPSEDSSIVTDGMIEYINLKGVTLKQALAAMLRPLNLTFVAHEDTITITSPAQLDKSKTGDPIAVKPFSPPGHNSKILDILEQTISMAPEDRRLRSVLELISDAVGLNIMVDNRVIDPASSFVDDDADLLDKTIREVFEEILPPLGLTYSVQEGFIWISSPENIKYESFESLVTEYYELTESDLEALGLTILSTELSGSTEEERFEFVRGQLDPILRGVKDPVSGEWLSFSYYNMEARQLIVHNTPTNHKRLDVFLEESRRDSALDNLEPDFDSVSSLAEAIDLFQEQSGKSQNYQHVGLLTEENVREAIRIALQKYDGEFPGKDKLSEEEYARARAHYQQTVRPICQKFVENESWQKGWTLSGFAAHVESNNSEVMGLRVMISTPGAAYEGFALPIIVHFIESPV